MDGLIIIDKPAGWTSHDVVSRMRRLAGTKRIGHLGTLDPMATGVLPLVIGRATRLAQFYTRNEKGYEGVIRLGFSTDTYDAEGTPASPAVAPSVDRAALEAALDRFRGTFAQVPPPVSAKKIGGTPAYQLARKNQPVELPPVTVTVTALELLSFEGTDAAVRIECGAGTYVRSIAHDTGVELGCGAHLLSLRRTRSGDFTLDGARTLAELEELAKAGRLGEALIPASRMLPEFPAELVDDLTVGQIRNGRDFRGNPFRKNTSRFVKAVTSSGELIAIGEAKLPNVYHPVLVL